MSHSERRTSFSLFTLCHFRQIHIFSNKEEKIRIQNVLTESEEKYLQSVENVKAMDRTGILRRALELKFVGKESKRRWLYQVPENINK
jgi:hypothetical protein